MFTLEATYKTLVQTGSSQEEGDHSNLTITIVGKTGQTKAIPLDETTKTNKTTPFKKDEKIEFDLKTQDVGKVRSISPISPLVSPLLYQVSKITLHQNSAKPGVRWHINNITIKRNYETTTYENLALKSFIFLSLVDSISNISLIPILNTHLLHHLL